MSGFVLVLEKSGEPCNRAVLEQMTRALEYRGPDGTGMQLCGSAGLGATLFRTLDESADAAQPLTLDGSVWIVGDVRLDDRAELVDRLRGAGCMADLSEPDLQLLLKTYTVWGDGCVERILGDFSFVLWDQERQRVFAARDHFGIRPLFYVDNDRILALSNTLECLRRHPAVDGGWDDLYLADALLFGWGQDPAASAFRQIRRLEAAHRLAWSDERLSREPYWELPCYTEPLRFRKPVEYVERFRDLLRTAVADRLRAPSVALELSGGVDSTCVAAAASDLCRTGQSAAFMHAWTLNSPQVLPHDREAEFAALAAGALGITHRIFNRDDYPLFHEKSGELVHPLSEPHDLTFLAGERDYGQAIRQHSRVLLTGHPGDGVLAGSPLHFQRLLIRGQWGRALWETVDYAVSQGRLPPFGVRSRIKQYFGRQPAPPEFPKWIRPDFAARLQLRDRWRQTHGWAPKPTNDLRQEAAQHLRYSWGSILERYDASRFGVPIDVRHPLFDLRVVSFLLQIPPLPWLANKELIRQLWPASLPKEIRCRPKRPLQGDPLRGRLLRGCVLPVKQAVAGVLANYIDLDQLPAISHECCSRYSSGICWMTARATSCGIWINQF